MLELAARGCPTRLRPVGRAPAPVRRRRLRARLHEPLLRPPRGGRARALPRRGPPRRAGARRRRLGAPRGRRAVERQERDPQRRLALAGLQALLRAGRAAAELGGGETLFAGRWFVAVDPLVTKVVPFIRVADAEASAEWYARLGFTIDWRTRAAAAPAALRRDRERRRADLPLRAHRRRAPGRAALPLRRRRRRRRAPTSATVAELAYYGMREIELDRPRRQPAPDRHARRRVTVRQELVPLAPLAPARQRPLPRLRRGRLPARVVAGARARATASARTSSARRRESSRARSGCPGAAAPARRCAAGSSSTATSSTRRFYCASVTRCYPGRPPSGRGDRTPTPREQELCEFWRDWELALLRPELIVTVGGLALRRLLGIATLTERDRQELHATGRDRDPAAASRRARAAGSTTARTAPGSARRSTHVRRELGAATTRTT